MAAADINHLCTWTQTICCSNYAASCSDTNWQREIERVDSSVSLLLGLELTAFLHASVDLIRFLLWAQLSNTHNLPVPRHREHEREWERESCAVCSVPHLELKKTLRKTQSSSVLPSFACVLCIFQHFQEYLQCLPYNKHSVKCFSFPLPLFPSLSSFLSLTWFGLFCNLIEIESWF